MDEGRSSDSLAARVPNFYARYCGGLIVLEFLFDMINITGYISLSNTSLRLMNSVISALGMAW